MLTELTLASQWPSHKRGATGISRDCRSRRWWVPGDPLTITSPLVRGRGGVCLAGLPAPLPTHLAINPRPSNVSGFLFPRELVRDSEPRLVARQSWSGPVSREQNSRHAAHNGPTGGRVAPGCAIIETIAAPREAACME